MIQRRRYEHARLERPEKLKAFRRIDAEQFMTCTCNLHRGPPRRVCFWIYSELRRVQSVGSNGSGAALTEEVGPSRYLLYTMDLRSGEGVGNFAGKPPPHDYSRQFNTVKDM